MAKDLTIRILGRPQVSKDDAVGYQRISRQYVVEGYRASYAGINDSNNPLFLAVGTEDEEFEGHYLVDQKISPKQGSVDVAYLTREFVEIRPTWSSEQFSHSNGFQRCSRTFVALRAVNSLGYSADNFQYHPEVSPQKDENPWKYAPSVVLNSEPTLSEEFDIPKGINFNQKWSRVSITVDTKSPGIDVWNVSWVSPIRPEGEPTITKDTAAGYQTVSRSYAISAEYYNKNKIFDSSNPLFLETGKADHEYTDHYLVNQQIKPLLNAQKGADEVEDLAVLTREFVQIRDTWSSEQFAQSRGFKRCSRTFVVIRAVNELGYSSDNFAKHPHNNPDKESSPWEYLPKVVENSEPYLSDLFEIPIKVEFNHTWHRTSISVDTKAPGIDVWNVSWTAPIRPQGEPTITKDNQIGYQTVRRSYAISAEFYTKNKIFDVENPLFLPVGTRDFEFNDHYLVNQQISPLTNAQKDSSDSTKDLAILTRDFVEVRDTWVSESVSSSSDLKKIRRNYVVLRADHFRGYSPKGRESTWTKHPLNESASGTTNNKTPWEYAPYPVSRPPEDLKYSYPTESPIEKTPKLGNVGLIQALISQSSNINMGKWLRGSAQVNFSNPGVDIWSVEWVSHCRPYWTLGGEKSLGSTSFQSPQYVEFDNNGLRISAGGSSGSGSVVGQVASFSFYVVNKTISTNLSAYWKGVSSSQPSVMLDFYLIPKVGGKAIEFRQLIKNAIFTSVGSTDLGGLATGSGMTNGFKFLGNYYDGDKKTSELPKFKNIPIADGGGTITYSQGSGGSTTVAANLSVVSTPVFTSSDPTEESRIFKVIVSYVG